MCVRGERRDFVESVRAIEVCVCVCEREREREISLCV